MRVGGGWALRLDEHREEEEGKEQVEMRYVEDQRQTDRQSSAHELHGNSDFVSSSIRGGIIRICRFWRESRERQGMRRDTFCLLRAVGDPDASSRFQSFFNEQCRFGI